MDFHCVKLNNLEISSLKSHQLRTIFIVQDIDFVLKT